ncbi:MAG: response regulator transcription factor [Deltaproteobacteria bacterium]|jgi:DNA-binding response OmpR family regulator|nr:response regulator transcription factor [Deltaproteobacteria bacterium]
MRLLVVEDELSLLDTLASRLSQEGYSVDKASDGQEAISYAEMSSYDCILLDIMLPKKDGVAVLKELRLKSDSTPVLLLTARDSIEDRVKGLDAGADDYLMKPFSHDELSARLRALLRRNASNKSNVLTFADLKMDLLKREVVRAGKVIALAAKEFVLLEYMLRNPNRVLTRGQIIDHVWNFDFDNNTNVVNVYIRYLRTKIDDGHNVKLIHTIRGMGYILKEKEGE